MTLRLLSILTASLLAAAPLPGDEVRLRDGSILIGRASVARGMVRIRTADGTVVVPGDQVLSIRSDAKLEAELRHLRSKAEQQPHAWIEIARQGWRWQLTDSMWRDLERCLKICPPSHPARPRLEGLLAQLEPELLPAHRLRAEAPIRVRELLRLARANTADARLAAIEAVLVGIQETGAETVLRERAERATFAVERGLALRAIDRRRRLGSGEFVWRRAVVDPSTALRHDLARWIAASDRAEQGVRFVADALTSNHAVTHYRAADALAEIGHPSAIPLLLAAAAKLPTDGRSLPGGSSRAHMAVVEQRAYVSDFDVEVAAGAAIATPKVRTLQSGTVLDVTVHSVISQRRRVLDAYRQALRALAGSDPGPDPGRWADWNARRRAGV